MTRLLAGSTLLVLVLVPSPAAAQTPTPGWIRSRRRPRWSKARSSRPRRPCPRASMRSGRRPRCARSARSSATSPTPICRSAAPPAARRLHRSTRRRRIKTKADSGEGAGRLVRVLRQDHRRHGRQEGRRGHQVHDRPDHPRHGARLQQHARLRALRQPRHLHEAQQDRPAVERGTVDVNAASIAARDSCHPVRPRRVQPGLVGRHPALLRQSQAARRVASPRTCPTNARARRSPAPARSVSVGGPRFPGTDLHPRPQMGVERPLAEVRPRLTSTATSAVSCAVEDSGGTVPSYRLIWMMEWRTQLADVAHAVAWVQHNIAAPAASARAFPDAPFCGRATGDTWTAKRDAAQKP